MTTLKEAREKGKLKQFIKEHEKGTPPADKDRFDAAMKSMTLGKPLKDQKSSG